MEDPDPDTAAERGHRTRPVTLSLSAEEQWTLHHILLDHVDAESTVSDSARTDPPTVEAVRAFEALDAGETEFTIAQLEAVRSILAEYHHSSTWWAVERPRIERLLHRVSEPIGSA